MGIYSWSLFEALIPPTDVTRESPLNTSDGTHQEVHFLQCHLSKFFRRLLDGSHDGSPWGVLIGTSLEESGCGADSWGILKACLELAPQ